MSDGARTRREAALRRLRSLQFAAMRWVASASYVRKWGVLGIAIGIIAGCGAIVFDEALQAASALFLHLLAGYRVPTPFLEAGVAPGAGPSRPWALPLIAAGGALLGAILVYRVAPEAEGHGTDAAISAVHHDPRGVRFRTVLVKLVASALTIGSGGSGGIFGPGMVIGAFVGAAVWRLFEPAFPWMGDDPTPYVIVGMMCCFGSIARAPLAMMLMVAEMTGSIGSIEPGMVAVGLAWLIVSRGETTIYRSQLISRRSDGGAADRRREAKAPI